MDWRARREQRIRAERLIYPTDMMLSLCLRRWSESSWKLWKRRMLVLPQNGGINPLENS